MSNTGKKIPRRSMSLKEIFIRLKTWQKILYLLWPLVIAVILTQNISTLIRLGTYRMNSISHEMTQYMKLEFDDYLLPVEHLINSMAVNIEQMVSEGAGADQVEEFLVRQTELMTGDFAADSTGLYGYFEGRYVDGAGWIPPEGYEPTERDWYIETKAAGNRIAYVAPYIDALTGENSVTVSRMLKDGKNLVALDLQLNTLQTIVDSLMKGEAESITGSQEGELNPIVCRSSLILDRNGKIVVHSDKSFEGRDIYSISGEPFTSIARNVLDENKSLFSIKYDGNYDSFTVVQLNEDWYAIAAVDYYDTFGDVITSITLTAIISVSIIVLLTISLIKAAAYAMRAEDDSKNTGTLAGFYSAVYKVYPYQDTYERLKGYSQKLSKLIVKEGQNAQQFFFDSIELTTNGENNDKLREFVDFKTLEERLNGVGSLTMEYLNTVNKWCRERFIPAERDVSGRLTAVMWVVEDIDAEKRAREELMQYSRDVEQAWEDAEEARYEAEKANKAKSIFLANMSHEIRTPINAVLGLDTMILRESREEKVRNYALNIQNAGQSLLSIINDILDLSKIESGKMEIVPVEYDLATLINDVSNMIMPKAESKELEFLMNIDPEIPGTLYGDDVRIRQVLVNLLTNAVKYTDSGSVTLAITYVKDGDEADLTCSVKDTGMGIAKEDLDKLFEEFVRIEEKKNRNIEGTGLGINIVSNLLNLMGSRLEVESTYGEGSEFRFTIRQGIVDEEPVGDLESRLKDRAAEYSYETGFVIPDTDILVVDDNEMNRYVFRSLLKELECRIDEAESGKRCLELTGSKKYDIIFMDHMMPGMDGIETFHRLRSMEDSPNLDTPVIVLTANAITGAKEQYMQEGFDDFLTKPIVPEKLEKLIGDLIPDDRKKPSSVRNFLRTAGRDEDREELPDVEGVDWDYALLKIKKTDALREVITDFRKTAAAEIDILAEMYEKVLSDEGDEAYNDYRVRVHAMKSSAALCGAIQVSSLAKVLELAARDRNRDRIAAVMPVFEQEWRRLKDLLDDAFGNTEGHGSFDGENDAGEGEKPVIDNVMFGRYLDRLKDAMEDLDTDIADAVMEELSGYSFDENTTGLLNRLSAAVTSLDTETADELIESIKTTL